MVEICTVNQHLDICIINKFSKYVYLYVYIIL